MKEIRTIIVDDEQNSIESLQRLLRNYCPQVLVIGTAGRVAEAIERIDSLKPDLVFLDITMPDGDGFDVLEQVKTKSFEVIFITASDQYAIKAFDFSAIHYLLKPIDYRNLQLAMDRYEQLQKEGIMEEKMEVLRQTLNNKHEKIILPTGEGMIIQELAEIIRCEADDNYTTFYLINGDKIVVSKSLSNFDKLLSDLYFSRVHSKHLINLRYVKKYEKGKGGMVVFQDGSAVPVSESKKTDFLNHLKAYARSLS